jgi:formylglycine-generating enzyme required for sulfatase activity
MRDYFTQQVKETLADRAGNRCSNPSCRKPTSGPREDPGKAVSIGVAAHITAASPGGPRYDPTMSAEERSSIDNGIWLCQNCAKLVDNDPEHYPVDLLHAWKEQAEQTARDEIEHRIPPRADALAGPDAIAAYLEIVRSQCGRVETRPYRQLSELKGAPPRLSLLDEEEGAGVYVPLRFNLYPSRASLEGAYPPGYGEGLALLQGGFAGDKEAWDRVSIPLKRSRKNGLVRGDLGLDKVLETPGHVVFIGKAGCGKTTILRLVATVLANADHALAHSELALDAESLPLPVFVALRDFEHACQVAPHTYRRDVDGFLRFLDDHFQRWHPDSRIPPGFLSELVRSGRTWLLLDALDEVADFDHRIAMRHVIERLADTFPEMRLLVTARVAAYAAAVGTAGANTRLDERFHVADVRDLTRKQWAPLIKRLYAGLDGHVGGTAGGVTAERAQRLLACIDTSEMLQEMVKTPLMVWTATLIHYADRELPEQRAELYRAYVDVLLGERLHEEESAEPAQVLREERWPFEERRLYLTYAAYQFHQRAEADQADRGGDADRSDQNGLVIVDERDLVYNILAPFMAKSMMLGGDESQIKRQAEREAQDFVAFMAERSGLLEPHTEGYSFGDHLTVQEFLAANYLVDNLRGTPEWQGFLQSHVGQSWWQEVFMLMAGYLLRWPQQAQRFLLDEMGGLPQDGDAHAYGLIWAGQALLQIPPERVSWHASAQEELSQRLVRVLQQTPPSTSVAARVEVGDMLGQLGDPRFGVTGTTAKYLLPDFVPVRGGWFWMGSDGTDRQARRDEMPRHLVQVGVFALARYATTNVTFAQFVKEGGYRDPSWWAEARAVGAWQPDGTVRDWLGAARRYPALWGDARFNRPSQPVVGVTWYEAVAYCRWLTAALDDGHTYRLPTEAEWERIARGPLPSPSGGRGLALAVRRRYPWGDKWEEGRANTRELDLGRTTPVGIFPDGASAEGVLDLAGNVWEWCSSAQAPYPYDATDGREDPARDDARILRGGACWDDRDNARCVSRIWVDPDHCNDIIGFRVARAPRY